MVGIHKGYDPRKNLNVCTMITKEMVFELQRWSIELGLPKVVFSAEGMDFPYPN